jgi:hypothetical protein
VCVWGGGGVKGGQGRGIVASPIVLFLEEVCQELVAPHAFREHVPQSLDQLRGGNGAPRGGGSGLFIDYELQERGNQATDTVRIFLRQGEWKTS